MQELRHQSGGPCVLRSRYYAVYQKSLSLRSRLCTHFNQVASEHFKTLERLTFLVDKIATSICRYQDLEALFISHERVRNAVGALYCDLLYFCTRVVHYRSKSFRHIFVSFDKEFGAVFDAIRLHGAQIDREAHAAHMKESKEARELSSAERQGKIHRPQN